MTLSVNSVPYSNPIPTQQTIQPNRYFYGSGMNSMHVAGLSDQNPNSYGVINPRYAVVGDLVDKNGQLAAQEVILKGYVPYNNLQTPQRTGMGRII